MNNTAICWIDQRIKPAHEAKISVFDHGLLYGDGIFEGLRFYNNRVFKRQAHLQRLQQSAHALSLVLPYNLSQISKILDEIVLAYPKDSGYLRLVVTRGVGSMGIDPQKCSQPKLFIIADELHVIANSEINEGIKLHIASTRRTPAECLDAKIKSLNYLNNILARIEATQAGCDEALMLNTMGYVAEGSVDNIFIIKQGRVMTPPVADGLLAGITREVIIQLAAELEFDIQEISLTAYDVINADECFLTGTGAELIAVRQVNHHVLTTPEEPLFPLIQKAFRDYVEMECA